MHIGGKSEPSESTADFFIRLPDIARLAVAVARLDESRARQAKRVGEARPWHGVAGEPAKAPLGGAKDGRLGRASVFIFSQGSIQIWQGTIYKGIYIGVVSLEREIFY